MRLTFFLISTLVFGLLALNAYGQTPGGFPIDPGAPRGGASAQVLLQIKAELAMELREIQRMVDSLAPEQADSQFAKMLKAQQSDALAQLLEIDKQLKAMGVNTDPPGTAQTTETPQIASPTVGTTNPGTAPVQPVLNNEPDWEAILKGEQRPVAETTNRDIPPELAELLLGGSAPQPVIPKVARPEDILNPSVQPPQDPWAPKPSKEIVELQTTVNSLQGEIKQLQKQIDSLEAQISLLIKAVSNDQRQRAPIIP